MTILDSQTDSQTNGRHPTPAGQPRRRIEMRNFIGAAVALTSIAAMSAPAFAQANEQFLPSLV